MFYVHRMATSGFVCDLCLLQRHKPQVVWSVCQPSLDLSTDYLAFHDPPMKLVRRTTLALCNSLLFVTSVDIFTEDTRLFRSDARYTRYTGSLQQLHPSRHPRTLQI